MYIDIVIKLINQTTSIVPCVSEANASETQGTIEDRLTVMFVAVNTNQYNPISKSNQYITITHFCNRM